MARPPRWADRINFAWKYLFNTCEAPFMLYFELGREPAGRAALALLSFGLDDLIRSFFRPKGLRTRRHGRKGRKNKRRPGLPETSDLIAERLPGYEEAKGRKVHDGARVLWKLDAIGQRVLYYFMLADVISDFAYDWTTAIIKHDNSQCPNTYRRLDETHGYVVLGTGYFFAPINVGENKYVHGPIGRFGSIYTVPFGTYTMTWSASVKRILVLDHNREFQLRILDLQTGEADYSGRYHINDDSTVDMISAYTFRGPRSVMVQLMTSGGPCEILEGEVFIYGYPTL